MPATPILSRPIPSTGEAMPVIGLGTWPMFMSAPMSARGGRCARSCAAARCGARMIDSSPMYGRAEGVVGDLLADLGARPRAFLATKVWISGRDEGVSEMRRSAASLRTGVIDLMQIHNLVDWRTHLGTLRQMKGKVASALSGSPIMRPARCRSRASSKPNPASILSNAGTRRPANGRAGIAAGCGRAWGRGYCQPAAWARQPAEPGKRPVRCPIGPASSTGQAGPNCCSHIFWPSRR